MGEAEGVAILGAHDRAVGYDVAQLTEIWTLDVDAFSTISVAGGSVWSLDRANGTVSRLDPRTSQALWTTPIGATSSFDVTGTKTAYILTTQAMIAVTTRAARPSGRYAGPTTSPTDRSQRAC